MPAVAAIDVGSNATRLSTLSVSSTGVSEHSHFERYALRLGADVFAAGRLGPDTVAALLRAFDDIGTRLAREGVRGYRAVATSAMRDARNGPSVVEQIRARCGLHVDIIGGPEESRLGRAALTQALGSVDASAVLLDLGGGSLEISRPTRGRGRSVPLGTVRLLAQHPALRGVLGAEALAEVRQLIGAAVREYLRGVRPARLAVGTGGNFDALARLLPAPQGRLAGIDLGGLTRLAARLAPLSAAQRAATFGLRPDRADLILPAALVLSCLAEALHLEQLVVPGTGLRDTLLRDLTTPAQPGHAARRLLGTGYDHAAIADRAVRLGRQLFTALGAAHGLWPTALQSLSTALYAWYFGAFLRADAACRHAEYVLRELDGLDLDGRSQAVAVHASRALAAPAPAPPAAAPPGWGGAAADAHAAAVVAALVRLTLALVSGGTRDAGPRVDLTGEAVHIDCDVSRPLPEAALAPLAAALARPVVVR